MTRPRLTVAEVIRDYGDDFLERYGDTLTPEQRRALKDLAACRTAALGGHVQECDQCGHRQIAYNSCRNRHCPKCQATAAARWLEARRRVAAGRVLPCRLHAAGCPRPDRLAESAGRLRPALPVRRRDPAPDRRRSRSTSAPRSASWPCCTPGARTCSFTRTSIASCPAAGCRRTARAGSPAARLLPAGPRPEPRVPRQVPGLLRAAFEQGKLSFHGKLAVAGRPGRFQRRLAAAPRPTGSCTPSRRSAVRNRC